MARCLLQYIESVPNIFNLSLRSNAMMTGKELKQIRKQLGLKAQPFGEKLNEIAGFKKNSKNVFVYVSWWEKGKKEIPEVVAEAARSLIAPEIPEILEIEEPAKIQYNRSAIMRKAWAMRREAAKKFGIGVMEVSWSLCMKSAWFEVKARAAA
jgi:transcriptional regulator with XRE-family HTH domain